LRGALPESWSSSARLAPRMASMMELAKEAARESRVERSDIHVRYEK
jgi:hypothetical protein